MPEGTGVQRSYVLIAAFSSATASASDAPRRMQILFKPVAASCFSCVPLGDS
jgi:hypothetical protein